MTVVLAKFGMLKIVTGAADRTAMLSPTLQFDVTSEQQQLLHAYQAQAASLKVTSEEFDGWLERIDELTGVEVKQLTALHGQLIASGMLKFEISGRSVGLKYQLSQQGKKALEVKAVNSDDADQEDEDQEVFGDVEDDAEVTAPAEILTVATADNEDRQAEPATLEDCTEANDSTSVETEVCHTEVCDTQTAQQIDSDEHNKDELANELKIQAQSEPELLETVAETQEDSEVDSMQNPSIAEAA